MAFLSIFFSVFLERYGTTVAELRRFDWLQQFTRNLAYANPMFDGYFGVACIVGGIGFVIGFIDLQLNHWWSLFNLVFNTVILYFCFGPRPFYEKAKAFRDLLATERKHEDVILHAEELIGRKLTETEQKNISQTVSEQLLIMVNTRLLGVVFWFLILGPLGAWIFRSTEQIADTVRNDDDESLEIHRAATKVFSVLNWPTSRLVSFTFLLVGNYIAGYRQIKALHAGEADQQFVNNERFVATTGLGALDFNNEISGTTREDFQISEVLALVRRTVTVWIGLIALYTLAT